MKSFFQRLFWKKLCFLLTSFWDFFHKIKPCTFCQYVVMQEVGFLFSWNAGLFWKKFSWAVKKRSPSSKGILENAKCCFINHWSLDRLFAPQTSVLLIARSFAKSLSIHTSANEAKLLPSITSCFSSFGNGHAQTSTSDKPRSLNSGWMLAALATLYTLYKHTSKMKKNLNKLNDSFKKEYH